MSNKIVPYNKRAMAKAGKTPGWLRGKGNIIVTQVQLGCYTHHIMWVDKDGNILFDQVIDAERGGGVFVPIDEGFKFGLQSPFRLQTRNFEKYQQEFPYIDYGLLGRVSLEVPRGFAIANESSEDAIERRTQVETQSSIVYKKMIGRVCANTAFDPHFTAVACGKVDPDQKPADGPDPNEKMTKGLEFFSVLELAEKVASNELYDCFSLSAIFATMLSEPDKWFKDEVLNG